MSGYTRSEAALWQAATAMADRGFRIAMVQLGWNAAAGEKTLVRNPPAKWQTEPPFPSTQVKAAIDAGCNAYLYRLPEGWWVVDADTAELTAEYTALLGPPDVTTPRGAHWVVDAPAKRLHKLDTGVRAFYGPGSFYPGPDGGERTYVGVVPDRPRPLPPALRRPAAEFGPVTPGEPTSITPDAASFAVARARDEWLASIKGGRHEVLIRYLAVLVRYRLAQGAELPTLLGELEAAALEHPDAQAGEEFETVGPAIEWAVNQARTTPWRIEAPSGFGARFEPPDPGAAPVGRFDDWGEDEDPDALTDEDYDGEWVAPVPGLLDLGGPVKLLYQGDDKTPRANTLFGAPGCGKTWLALTAVVQLAEAGQRCWYVDYENSRPELVARMRALGLSRAAAKRITYTRASTEDPHQLHERMRVRGGRYGLMVLDGWNAALRSMGVDENSTGEVTGWYQRWVVTIPTVLILDHVAKNADGFGPRTAIGSQAKGAVLSGVEWFVEKVRGFGTQSSGSLRLTHGKDRPGGIDGRFVDGRVQVDVKVADGGRRVELKIPTMMGEPVSEEEVMFGALYADGVTASVTEREFMAAWRERDPAKRAPGKARVAAVLGRWRQYWADRENGATGPNMNGL